MSVRTDYELCLRCHRAFLPGTVLGQWACSFHPCEPIEFKRRGSIDPHDILRLHPCCGRVPYADSRYAHHNGCVPCDHASAASLVDTYRLQKPLAMAFPRDDADAAMINHVITPRAKAVLRFDQPATAVASATTLAMLLQHGQKPPPPGHVLVLTVHMEHYCKRLQAPIVNSYWNAEDVRDYFRRLVLA